MGKGKKGGKRLTKKQLVPKLEELFSSNPGKTMSFKEIFRSLHLDTHPLKMLAIDIMEEMAWDDFITKVSDNSYQLNQKGQVQEGVFLRKTNGKNTITPDGSDKPISWLSATRCGRSAATACASRAWHVARTI